MGLLRKGIIASQLPSGATAYFMDTYTNTLDGFTVDILKMGQGDIMQLRNDSDAEQLFTKDELTDGTLATFIGTGNGYCVDWIGSKGVLTMTQSISTRQPYIARSGTIEMVNGKPALYNDVSAGGRNLKVTLSGVTWKDNGVTIIAVVKRDTGDTSATQTIVGSRIDDDDRFSFGLRGDAGNEAWRTRVDDENTTGIGCSNTNNTNVQALVYFVGKTDGSNFSDAEVYANNDADNGTLLHGVNGSGSDNDFAIFNNGDSIFRYSFVGWIQEIIIFQNDESSNRAAQQTEVNDRFSIYS